MWTASDSAGKLGMAWFLVPYVYHFNYYFIIIIIIIIIIIVIITIIVIIITIIVSITKFLIVIGSLHAYLSHNRCAIRWVSNYRCLI